LTRHFWYNNQFNLHNRLTLRNRLRLHNQIRLHSQFKPLNKMSQETFPDLEGVVALPHTGFDLMTAFERKNSTMLLLRLVQNGRGEHMSQRNSSGHLQAGGLPVDVSNLYPQC
jgi:hypothetical protein